MQIEGYVRVGAGTPVEFELDSAEGTARIIIGQDRINSTFLHLDFRDSVSWLNFVNAVAAANKTMLNQNNALEAGPTDTRAE